MEFIKTVDELIEVLENSTTEGNYLRTMQSINIPISEFEKYYTWNPDAYTRNCLLKTDHFELLLICYEKGQETPIHDFDSQQAWINTVQGKIKEWQLRIAQDGKSLEQLSSITIGCEDYSFMNKVGIHQYKNVYEARSVSLNLYSKPIESWTQYDKNAKAKTIKVNYDSVYV